MNSRDLRRYPYGLCSVVLTSLAAISFSTLDRISVLRCPLQSTIGITCPGCGSTRCIAAFKNGDVSAAFNANPIICAAVFGLAAFLVIGIVSPIIAVRIRKWLIYVLESHMWPVLAAIVAFTIFRNLE